MERQGRCLLCPFRENNTPYHLAYGAHLPLLSIANIVSFRAAFLKLIELVGYGGFEPCGTCGTILHNADTWSAAPGGNSGRWLQMEPLHLRLMIRLTTGMSPPREEVVTPLPPTPPPDFDEEPMDLASAFEMRCCLGHAHGTYGNSSLQHPPGQYGYGYGSTNSGNGVVAVANQQPTFMGIQAVVFIASATMTSPSGKLRHHCTECFRVFQFKVTLDWHVKRHHENAATHGCSVCGFECIASSTSFLTFRSHYCMPFQDQPEAFKMKPFRCEHCGKLFTRQQNFSTHLGFHDKALSDKPGNCKFCRTRFPTQKKLEQHMTHHGVGVGYDLKICPKCNMGFRDEREMLIHHSIIHLPNACSICKRRFALLSALRRHTTMIHTNKTSRR